MLKDWQSSSRRSLRSIVIEPFKQVRFGLYIVGVSLVFAIVGGYLFYLGFSEQYQQVISIFNIVEAELQWEVLTNEVFFRNAIIISLFLTSYVVFIFWIVFVITHRYYGPMVSIERFIDQLADGQFQLRLKVRQKDELQGIVGKLNNLAENLDAKYSKTDDVS